VTSPRRIEGKSLTALNLALTMAADYDAAVLLVDADMSGHGLQAMFGFDGAPGLSDHLTNATPINELLINPGVPRFVLLPAGQKSVLNSAELLSTKLAQQLIQEMKERYQDRTSSSTCHRCSTPPTRWRFCPRSRPRWWWSRSTPRPSPTWKRSPTCWHRST
jgi:hypothetical protein